MEAMADMPDIAVTAIIIANCQKAETAAMAVTAATALQRKTVKIMIMLLHTLADPVAKGVTDISAETAVAVAMEELAQKVKTQRCLQPPEMDKKAAMAAGAAMAEIIELLTFMAELKVMAELADLVGKADPAEKEEIKNPFTKPVLKAIREMKEYLGILELWYLPVQAAAAVLA